MKKLFAAWILLSSCAPLFSQNFVCGTDEYTQKTETENPIVKQWREENDSIIYSILSQVQNTGLGNLSASGTTYTIPVVFHIIALPGTAIGTAENISDATVQTAVNNLNLRFSNSGSFYNANGVAIPIQFCLATRDTLGNPTNGINRVASTLSNINVDSADAQLKNLSRWNTCNYLNIWVVKSICYPSSGLGCNVGGYSTLAWGHCQNSDGVVCRYSYVTGTTLKHEVGHYFNLYHTFTAGTCLNNNCLTDGDKVCDTPPSSYNGSSCSINSCSTDTNDYSNNNPYRPTYLGGLGDQPDPQANVMSYSNCGQLFTVGQRERMMAALLYVRQSLLYSHGCGDTTNVDAGILAITSPDSTFGGVCSNPVTPTVKIINYGLQILNNFSLSYRIDTNPWQQYNWNGSLFTDSILTINLLPQSVNAGYHTLTVVMQNVNGLAADEFDYNDTMRRNFVWYPKQTAICEEFNTLPNVPLYWYAKDYWFTTANDDYPTWGPYWQWTQDSCVGKFLAVAWFHIGNNGQYNGHSHMLRLPNPDFSQFSEVRLSYKIAHKPAYANAVYPKIEIRGTYCDQSYWSPIVNDSSFENATVSGFDNSIGWYPQSCSDWQTRTVNVCYFNYNNYKGLEFWIHADSTAQNIYVDSICLSTVPKPNAGVDQIVCSTTAQLNANSVPGGYWQVLSGPWPYSFSNVNSSTSTFTGVNNSTYRLFWNKPSNGCFSFFRDTVEIKFSKPAAPTINAPSPLCQGNNILLTASLIANTTYSWFGPNSFSSALQNPTISNASTLYTGSYGAFVIDTNGCRSDTVYRTVQVKPLPVLSPVASDTFPCLGASINLSCLGTATTYTWASVAGSGITTQNGQSITATPTVPANFTYKVTGTLNGCADSASTSITVRPAYQTSLNTTICQGDSLDFFGQQLKQTGNFTQVLQAVNGCDSTIHLALIVSQPSSNFTANICIGQQFYFAGQFLSQTGVFKDTVSASNGCDSIITLSLFTHDLDSTFLADEICNQHSYQIGDSIFTQTGNYIVPFTNQFGCDSVVHLSLTIQTPIDTVLSVNGQSLSVAWDSSAVYQWVNCSSGQIISGASSNTFLATQNGNYAAIISVRGCSDTTECAQIALVGLEEIAQDAISVIPNPSTGVFILSISINSLTSIEISCLNILGEKIFTRNYVTKNNFKEEFNISAMADGVYSLQVKLNNKLIQKKLVLSK